MKKIFRKKESGFTIIEVTIVLAIAGLIMAIVFVAVPSLERSSRNTQRKSDASHLAGLINEYSSNHAGLLPTAIGSGGLTVSGENWSIMSAPTTSDINTNAAQPAYGNTTTMKINEGMVCNPATNVISDANNDRAFAIGFQVETSGGSENSCVSN
jgi:prepilin-type N-terminal cleavage/methylation domain-containing protein